MSQRYISFKISGTCPIPTGAKMEDAFTLHQSMGIEHVEDVSIAINDMTIKFAKKESVHPIVKIMETGVPSDIDINDITLSIEYDEALALMMEYVDVT